MRHRLASAVRAASFAGMSTLAEIEEAIERLPAPEKEELFVFLAQRIKRHVSASSAEGDPFAAMIGAFAGPCEATGRNAEAILYGRGS